jgi:hypothetical protein
MSHASLCRLGCSGGRKNRLSFEAAEFKRLNWMAWNLLIAQITCTQRKVSSDYADF